MNWKPTQTLRLDPALTWPEAARTPAVWRYTFYLMLLGICGLFQTGARIDARDKALALDRARVRADVLRVQNERLVLELASLHNVRALDARATDLGLVPAQVEEVPVGP